MTSPRPWRRASIATAALALVLAGCSSDSNDTEDTGENTDTQTSAPAEPTTQAPTQEPTQAPTEEPTEEATEEPTAEPTEEGTEEPTSEPTEEPTQEETSPEDGATDESTEGASGGGDQAEKDAVIAAAQDVMDRIGKGDESVCDDLLDAEDKKIADNPQRREQCGQLIATTPEDQKKRFSETTIVDATLTSDTTAVVKQDQIEGPFTNGHWGDLGLTKIDGTWHAKLA